MTPLVIQITHLNQTRALKAYDQFDCKNFGDYMHAYLKLDVLLLADIFETFRTKCLSDYELDPANFITLPQFSFAVAFRGQLLI